ncbi:MAG TPA: nucleotidyltransferase [Candidatus Salinicoccus merdavium]|nr:nucleotidyltransferase [Candidatus Salinicoccus merdavium]
MLVQYKMIQNVKQKSTQDEKVAASMMYGSFTKGEGDRYSDVEFYLFIKDDELEGFNTRQWISDIHPADLIFHNEFGTEVAIFSNMIRGEFHFLPVSEMEIIQHFKPTGVFPDTESMFIYDDTGKLKPLLDELGGPGPKRLTDENVNFAFNNFVNAWLMGINVLRRGETARALETLTYVQRYILQLIRVEDQSVERWLNSTKNLEKDISNESYVDYISITAKLDDNELWSAYEHALKKMNKLYESLNPEYTVDLDNAHLDKLYQYLSAEF